MLTIGLFKRPITRDDSRDTGAALVLLLLILHLSTKREGFVFAAIALHVLNMTAPLVYRPAAVVWMTLSHFAGAAVSKVLLSIVFFVIVTPTGILRRLAGKDSLKLREFKASGESVMLERNHRFVSNDIERPY